MGEESDGEPIPNAAEIKAAANKWAADPLGYAAAREIEAKRLHIPKSVLDNAINAVRKGTANGYDATEKWREKLIYDDRGPQGILANAITALGAHQDIAGRVAFDEHASRTMVVQQLPWAAVDTARQWRDVDDIFAAEWLQRQGIKVGVDITAQAIQVVASRLRFHPIRDYLESLAWDGQARIDTWTIRLLGVPDSVYCRAVSQAWLISAVARVYQPGCQADHVLVLEGITGAGKTSTFRILGGGWYREEAGDLGSKDAMISCQGAWVIELGELASLQKSEIGRLNAFITRNIDNYRSPYGRRNDAFPRQCVFGASVEHDEWRKDDSGARRWWPLRCGAIDLDALKTERNQLWAEALAQYRLGEPWHLIDREARAQATEEAAQRIQADPWDNAISGYLSGITDTCVRDILSHVLDIKIDRFDQLVQNRVVRHLKASGWIRYQRRIGDKREWRYRRLDLSPVSKDVSPPESLL